MSLAGAVHHITVIAIRPHCLRSPWPSEMLQFERENVIGIWLLQHLAIAEQKKMKSIFFFPKYLIRQNWTRHAALLAIVGAIISFIYNAYQANQVNLRESRKPFLEKQFAVYSEILKTTSKLTVQLADKSQDKAVIASAEAEFDLVFFGDAEMVASEKVEFAMTIFKSTLLPGGKCTKDAEKRRYVAVLLTRCIRDSIAEGWGFRPLGTSPITPACTNTELYEIADGCFNFGQNPFGSLGSAGRP
jgi:hypothetical protein